MDYFIPGEDLGSKVAGIYQKLLSILCNSYGYNQDDLRGRSEYLFENSRINNIITNVYHDPFTSAMHEVAKDFKLSVNEVGYFVQGSEDNA